MPSFVICGNSRRWLVPRKMSVPNTIFTPAFIALRKLSSCTDARRRSRCPRRFQGRPSRCSRPRWWGSTTSPFPTAICASVDRADRVAAAIDALQADAAVGVARYFLAPVVRFVDDGLESSTVSVGCETSFRFCQPRAVRHVDLDPVGAVVELLRAALASTGPSTICAPFGMINSGA